MALLMVTLSIGLTVVVGFAGLLDLGLLGPLAAIETLVASTPCASRLRLGSRYTRRFVRLDSTSGDRLCPLV